MPRKPKAKPAELPAIPPELLEQFGNGPMTAESIHAASLAFKKAVFERALGGEMNHHLGYPPGGAKPAHVANQRNGHGAKTVLTEDGHAFAWGDVVLRRNPYSARYRLTFAFSALPCLHRQQPPSQSACLDRQRYRVSVFHIVRKNGVGPAFSPVVLLSVPPQGIKGGPTTFPFWAEPVSAFGSSKMTMFISDSDTLTMPSSQHPSALTLAETRQSHDFSTACAGLLCFGGFTRRRCQRRMHR